MLNIESALYVCVQAIGVVPGTASLLQRFAPGMAYRVLDFWKPDGVLQPYLLLSNGTQRSFVPIGFLRAVAFRARADGVCVMPLAELVKCQDRSIHLHALVAREYPSKACSARLWGSVSYPAGGIDA